MVDVEQQNTKIANETREYERLINLVGSRRHIADEYQGLCVLDQPSTCEEKTKSPQEASNSTSTFTNILSSNNLPLSISVNQVIIITFFVGRESDLNLEKCLLTVHSLQEF